MQYQCSTSSRSGCEGVDVPSADSQSPRICGNLTRSALALDFVATDHQDPLHRIESATASDDHWSRFPRRPNMQEEFTQYFHRPSTLPQGGSEPVSPTSRRVASQTEIDNDSTTEDDGDDDGDDEMLVTADEQDYGRETIDDGAPKTAEEIRAEKRKQKRFRYLQAGGLERSLSLLLVIGSRIIKPAFYKVNSLDRLTPMQHSASDCRKRSQVSVLDRSKSGSRTGKTLETWVHFLT